jgi:hypothetical protein
MVLRFALAWAACYTLLMAYMVYGAASNAPDFVNCRAHRVLRPTGIFCATALVCFTSQPRRGTAWTLACALVCLPGGVGPCPCACTRLM